MTVVQFSDGFRLAVAGAYERHVCSTGRTYRHVALVVGNELVETLVDGRRLRRVRTVTDRNHEWFVLRARPGHVRQRQLHTLTRVEDGAFTDGHLFERDFARDPL